MSAPPPFSVRRPVVGMVHLDALPGAPRFAGSMDAVLDRARSDAEALAAGGVDGVMIENFGDVPFFADRVPAETIAAMTLAVAAVREGIAAAGRAVGGSDGSPAAVRLGINVLRNDARAALAIASVTGAAFVRVNVHTGEMHTDQGTITGRAAESLRARTSLPGRPAILADVFVKHATPPAGARIEDAARDLVERGLADGVIVSGSGTGAATPIDRLRAVRGAIPDAPIWVGSGADPDTVEALLAVADGLIVGSALKRGGRASEPVDPDRVRALVERVRALA